MPRTRVTLSVSAGPVSTTSSSSWSDATTCRSGRSASIRIPHSGVKELDYTTNSMLTFRDPDNIQLEFFWRAPLDVEA